MPDALLDIQEIQEGLLIKVKVVPRASRTQFVGILGGALKIAVAAAPEKGKANNALIGLLANRLRVPASSICVHQGASSAHKVIRVQGLTAQELLARL